MNINSSAKLVSIIVPIYNVESYLDDCLNSFVIQTSQDFFVYLIDDGSTDKSSEIAKGYANKYPSLFKYIRQENKGLGGARNTGLTYVDTEYVMFFDSDDFMANRAIERIVDHISKSAVADDIIFFNPVIYDYATKAYEPWHDSWLIKSLFENTERICPRETPKLMESEASVCRAVWKTEFLKRINLNFLEHTHWEDVPPHFLLMHEAESASFLRYEGAYYYRFNTGTQITSGSGKSRLDMKHIFNEIKPYFKNKNWDKLSKAYMISFLANYLFWSINVVNQEYLPQFIDICHDFFKTISLSQYLCFFRKTETMLRDKIMIWFLKSHIFYRVLKDKRKIGRYMKVFKLLRRQK